MSLNWNLSKIKNYKTVCRTTDGGLWDLKLRRSELHPVTYRLIWGTMAVGIPTITEKNADKFFSRFRIWTKMFDEPEISRDDVRAHIGLETNVSTKTDSEFLKGLMRASNLPCE